VVKSLLANSINTVPDLRSRASLLLLAKRKCTEMNLKVSTLLRYGRILASWASRLPALTDCAKFTVSLAMSVPQFSRTAMRLFVLCVLATPAVFSWAKPTVSVSVHGVNYSNETFSFSLEDPTDNKGASVGELVDRFAAGGTVCCYDLPKEWQPGIKIKVNSVHWRKETADKKLPEVKQVFVVEVPPYVDGKPGELWVLRQPDGTVNVVSSGYQPNHEKWPGQVKGWPVPSLEYRRERWALYLSIAEHSLKSADTQRRKMDESIDEYARDAWPLIKKYRYREVKEISGPDDPKFHDLLVKENASQLDYLRLQVKRLKDVKP
jgi:hypothetical protein